MEGAPVATSVGPSILVSVLLFLGLLVVVMASQRTAIMANWASYRMNPFYLMMAPFLKPSEDPRSAFQFASDNYSEVLRTYIDKAIAVVMAPVYKVFEVLSTSIGSAANGVAGVRALLSNLFGSFQSMVNIFMRRFGSVGHALIGTFQKLLQAMEKTWAVAVGAVYTGLSTVHAMQNTLRLMVTISITILVILAVMIFFFFFALWPLLPLIILGGVMVGDVTGTLGMNNEGADAAASLACFDPETPVVLADGSTRRLRHIAPGVVLHGGAIVEGVLRFEDRCDVYSLRGVVVTGSHIVYEDGVPSFVADHPEARPCGTREAVVCLVTSNRRIPVLSDRGLLQFADWEELDEEDTEAQQAWYETVFTVLNGTAPSGSYSQEEAGLSGATRIATESGSTPIRSLRPGDRVLDADGRPTRITGVVELAGGVRSAAPLAQGAVTTGCWKREKGLWAHPSSTQEIKEPAWYHVFTESGTFVAEGWPLRDFSDLGPDLPITYADTLAALQKNGTLRKQCCLGKPSSHSLCWDSSFSPMSS